MITDGLERNSSVKEKEVMEAIKENEVQVYLVGFISEDEPQGLFNRSPAKKAKELLTRLAEDSGGRAFFPKEVSEMAGDRRSDRQRPAHSVRRQLLSFKPVARREVQSG